MTQPQPVDDPLALTGFDAVELWVGNARQAAHFYRTGYGFRPLAYAGPETGVRDRASYVLAQGEVRLVLTTALTPDSPIAEHVARHGDGVRDVGLGVLDARRAFETAVVERGARPVLEPEEQKDEHGVLRRAAIATYGDTVHSLVDRSGYHGPHRPGYVAWETVTDPLPDPGLRRIDHVVGNVELGRMDTWVVPDAYYDDLADRFADLELDVEALKELGILADRDDEGHLLQIFTKMNQDRPTVFFEMIERHGSRGFGEGNFKALFMALEREQAARGNL